MKTSVLTFIFSVSFFITSAQIKILEGTIDTYPITMILQKEMDENVGKEIWIGHYYYNRYGEPILLKQKSESLDQLVLSGYDLYYVPKETFNGLWKGDTYIGTWTSGKKEFPFSLLETYKETFETYIFKDSLTHSFKESNEKVMQYSSNITLFKDSLKAEKIRQVLNDTLDFHTTQALQQYDFNTFKEGYLNQMDLSSDKEFRVAYLWEWEESLTPRLWYQDIVVFNHHSWGYFGGAHGSGYLEFILYDEKENQVLTEEDIFKQGSEEAIADLLDTEIRHQYPFPISKEINLQEADIDNNCYLVDRVPFTSNFYPNAKGITFFYNSYELEAYACGTREILLTWESLRPYLKESFVKRL